MLSVLSEFQKERTERGHIPDVAFCEEKKRLQDDFLDAIHDVNFIQNQQTQAVIEGDPDFSRFDVLLHFAQEKKDIAKYAWIAHVESHGCGEG